MNIYVGNIPWAMTNSDLKCVFSQYGAVKSAVVIMHKDTGKSKGFGFVEMDNPTEGEKAIAVLNGADVFGRPIIVSEKVSPARFERATSGS